MLRATIVLQLRRAKRVSGLAQGKKNGKKKRTTSEGNVAEESKHYLKQDVTESNQDNGEAVMAKDQQKKCKNEKITRHETSEANHDLKQDVTESNQEKEAVKANDRNSTKLEGPAKKKRKRSQ